MYYLFIGGTLMGMEDNKETKDFSNTEKRNTTRKRYRLVSDDTIGERIREARIARQLTQTELAVMIGTVYQRVHEWESDWKKPSARYLEKLAEVLSVNKEWIETGALDVQPLFLDDPAFLDVMEDLMEERIQKERKKSKRTNDFILTIETDDKGPINVVIEFDYLSKRLKKHGSLLSEKTKQIDNKKDGGK